MEKIELRKQSESEKIEAQDDDEETMRRIREERRMWRDVIGDR